MTDVDRRRLLTSLAACAASVSFASMASAAGVAEPIPDGHGDRLCDAWLTARQPRRAPATQAMISGRCHGPILAMVIPFRRRSRAV
jgi:hypothetical protein